MKIGVVFPSVMYRNGPEDVQKLIRGIEDIGFDQFDMFDHVVMGYPTETRPKPFYSPQMPIMEALTMLSYAAAITEKITLGTGVLVLPQRQIALVAKQVSTMDILSGGRIRLGVGVGWQQSEYEALQENFSTRGRRMDEAIHLLRAYWEDEHVNFEGIHYQVDEIAMEPKPPQRGRIPIWVGGTAERTLKRVGELADGWMAMTLRGDPPLEESMARVRRYAEAAGRNPESIGMQMSLSPDPLDKERRKKFYSDPQFLLERMLQLRELGFDQASIDCVPIFQEGYRTVDAMLDYLGEIYRKLKPGLDSKPD